MTRSEALHYIAAKTGGIVNRRTDRYLDHDDGKWRDGEPYPISVTSHGFHVSHDGAGWLIEWMSDLERAPWYGAVAVGSPDDVIAVIRESHRWREVQAKWESA